MNHYDIKLRVHARSSDLREALVMAEDIAEAVREATGRPVTLDDVEPTGFDEPDQENMR